jgi:hypothetical protein
VTDCQIRVMQIRVMLRNEASVVRRTKHCCYSLDPSMPSGRLLKLDVEAKRRYR